MNNERRHEGSVDGAESARVERFLRDNPDWLSRQAGLYDCLSPPRRVHGEALADHMAAMIEAARARSRVVLDAGRAGMGLGERVRAAVVALIRAEDVADWVSDDLPRLLGVDAARLCLEGGNKGGFATVAPGTVARVLGGHDVVLRAAGSAAIGASAAGSGTMGGAAIGSEAESASLHGEAAGLAVWEALLRVPRGDGPALLALAARDHAMLEGAGAEGALGFLASALGARLERA
ncbi:hypothetical protein NFI95_03110 [Acetobacteraceae bacterium KSS8]|uniref:DUF484 family protein n=1 Tax=Endosaccharibacter trunci TaxID=2812733 RepID=A0ABT1W4V0_9PROT|nr:hypothetical protein [Acetobacteraceae bacterium KSS8]